MLRLYAPVDGFRHLAQLAIKCDLTRLIGHLLCWFQHCAFLMLARLSISLSEFVVGECVRLRLHTALFLQIVLVYSECRLAFLLAFVLFQLAFVYHASYTCEPVFV